MGLLLRLVLIFFSVGTAAVIMVSVRRSHMQIEYSIFWFIFSALIIFMALFPQPVIWASRLLGFQSPSNFVYLIMIFMLLVKSFTTTMRLSKLDTRLTQLAEYVALRESRADGDDCTLPRGEDGKRLPGE